MNIGYISADFGVPVFGFKGASIHVREMIAAMRQGGHNVCILSSAMHAGKGSENVSNMGATGFKEIPVVQRALFNLPDSKNGAKAGDIDFCAINTTPAHLSIFEEIEKLDQFWGKKTRIKQELRNLLYNVTLTEQAQACLGIFPVDFIYERYSLFAYAGLKVARSLKLPHILEVNAPLAYEQEKMRGLEMKTLAHDAEDRIFRETDHIFVVSDELKTFVESRGGDPEKIEVLPNSVDPERFNKADAQRVRSLLGLEKKRILGFVGSLKPWHGTESLVEAFSLLDLTDTHLLIVGDGPMREELEMLAIKKGIKDNVTFTGKVSYDEIPDYIAAMDIPVAPYLPNDNFYFSPIKIFEYMSCSKPVVAGRIGQIEQIIQDGENGFTFIPGNIEDLKKQLQRLLIDAPLRESMGKTGKAWVDMERTWKNNARIVLKTAEKLKMKNEN